MVLCSGGGTPHRPPLIRQGRIIHESHACAHYLMAKHALSPDVIVKVSRRLGGSPPVCVCLRERERERERGSLSAGPSQEWSSYDTIGNAYFSLTQHVVPRAWSNVVVVTNEFHLPRTRAGTQAYG